MAADPGPHAARPVKPKALNYALIPAAGTGSRVGGELPKQYRDIAGRPMICHALETFAKCEQIARVFVVIEASDAHFERLPLSALASQRIECLRVGGASRHESVENGLEALGHRLDDDDWILVHDAARPGLSQAMLERLITAVGVDAIGGILALPVADTLKRAQGELPARSLETASRVGLWQAQTPQMFPYRALRDALQSARAKGKTVTDEASAIEMAGGAPLLVLGHCFNFKVTYADDLQLAQMILAPA